MHKIAVHDKAIVLDDLIRQEDFKADLGAQIFIICEGAVNEDEDLGALDPNQNPMVTIPMLVCTVTSCPQKTTEMPCPHG